MQGYLPMIAERREAMLERKRQEYHNFIDQYYSTRLQDIHQDTYRQVRLIQCCDHQWVHAVHRVTEMLFDGCGDGMVVAKM